MWQRRRRLRSISGLVAFIALLAVCVIVSYQIDIAATIGYHMYRNTSLPVASSAGGVTLRLAHSRYLTIETFTLTLTNQSAAPIYLPATSDDMMPAATVSPHDLQPGIDGTLSRFSDLCLAIGSEIRNAQGWQPQSHGCVWERGCPGDMAPPLPSPVMLVIAPGETAVFPLYDGQGIYPPWSPGVYRFSALYARAPFLTPGDREIPREIPDSATLTTPPVTLTSAWWYPSDYHQTPPRCPGRMWSARSQTPSAQPASIPARLRLNAQTIHPALLEHA